MGKGLARLIGSGIAFTSEAAHAARHRNKDSVSVSETPRSISGVESDCGDSVGADSRTTYTVALEGRAELPNRECRSEWGSERGLPTEDEVPPYSPGLERQRDINKARSSSEVEEKRGYHYFETGKDTETPTLDTRNDRERSMDGDEAAWQLDEATEEFGLPTYDQTETHPGPKGAQKDFDMSVDNDPDEISAQDSEDEKAKKRERMIRSLVALAGPPPAQPQRLPCPVIIPQRRPGAKKRGFVRAYAPVLADCGISQDVFLKFISDFHKASQASMWLQVIVCAANITGFSPSLAVALTAAAIQIVADTAQQFQIRHRTNSYLDRANQEIFMPRGQYAMIMKFTDQPPKLTKKQKQQRKQDSNSPNSEANRLGQLFSTEQINFNQSGATDEVNAGLSQPERPEFDAAATISKYTHSKEHPQMNAWKQRMQHYRLGDGATRGEMQLPECAPLVFPEIDRAAIRVRDGLEPKSNFQSGRTWVRDYIDRKSQASFEAQHQGSALAVPESGRKAFTSRYNDPNHPVNSGNLLTTLSGGLYQPKPSLFERAGAAIKETQDKKRAAQGLPPSETWKEKWARKKKETGSRIKILREDVMYLMIVNMPTEEELKESVAKLQYLAQQGDLGRGGTGGMALGLDVFDVTEVVALAANT
ncbi:uncharacterized protein N7518_010481 [Penicillium psychrosexuale]|uniref:uncharacterized protein n=1 Tax=Penicillium psychrosexuale TaxID=1002107 RepID=UPI002545B09B|nr:uncharacterized protein N7518_010481 [Penicillium psychrosexuale]KAJ5781998.1 hypothetical protein N7518_010481 [Penicillium psychrosexuale]